jgi:hypothetical protein
MVPPRLTFYSELDPGPLQSLFDDRTIVELAELKANLSLGILDLSGERAAVVQRLNQAGVPVIAWLLLPKEDGYWFNLDNAPQAANRYLEFKNWTVQNGLKWTGIGLDIEPDIRDLTLLPQRKWRMLPGLLKHAWERKRYQAGRSAYLDLIAQIHADGYPVESYQFPMMVDERRAGSTLLQRMSGIVDLPVDREVWMLYSSLLRPYGPGMLTSYAPEAQSIAIGVTGGGGDSGLPLPEPLTWEEFGRDLRLSWYWCNDLYIFSLEGCVQQGFLERLKTFEWDQPVLLPGESQAQVDSWRAGLRTALWVSAHFTALLLALAGLFLLWKGLSRYFKLSRKKIS